MFAAPLLRFFTFTCTENLRVHQHVSLCPLFYVLRADPSCAAWLLLALRVRSSAAADSDPTGPASLRDAGSSRLLREQKELVCVNRGPVGVTASGGAALLHTVYPGWRLHSPTISWEICYCSLLNAVTGRIWDSSAGNYNEGIRPVGSSRRSSSPAPLAVCLQGSWLTGCSHEAADQFLISKWAPRYL